MCTKITIMTHKEGVQQATVAILNDANLAKKVDRVVALAPCYFMNPINYEIPLNDIQSIEFLRQTYINYGLSTIWGPIFEQELDAKVCPTDPSLCAILKGINSAVGSNFPSSTSYK